jgi:prophage antirepressor-like protein
MEETKELVEESNQIAISESTKETFKILFGTDLRIYGTEENPLFIAKDVAQILEIANIRKTLSGRLYKENEHYVKLSDVPTGYSTSRARKTQDFLALTEAEENFDFIKMTLSNREGQKGGALK